jgi:3'-phosphoadenosine 5'-phosphosulfate sulfotransferase (PAPS reductase)/FAD synthetase
LQTISGGRDSHFLLYIIRNILKLDNTKFPAIYAKTYNEFHEIRHRIEEQDITSVSSGRHIFEVFEKEGLPLFGKEFSKWYNDFFVRKWKVNIKHPKILADFKERSAFIQSVGWTCSDKCCKLMKEDCLKKSKIVGLRESERGRRSAGNSKNYDFCIKNHKTLFKPIFDVTDEELVELEKFLGIQNPNIYTFLKRTGCVMCGFGTKKDIKNKLSYLSWFEPSRYRFYIKYFRPYLKYRGIV